LHRMLPRCGGAHVRRSAHEAPHRVSMVSWDFLGGLRWEDDPAGLIQAGVADQLRLRKIAIHTARSSPRAVVGVIEDAIDHRREVPRYLDDERTRRKFRGSQMDLASGANRQS